MGGGRRALIVAILAACAVLLVGAPADAHAYLDSSDPSEGARLDRPPSEIVLRFSEEPEGSLSSVRVLDTAGTSYERSPPEPLAGDERSVRVMVAGLGDGVYTVAWRVVSRVDGHATGGAFAFGVNADPSGVVIAPPEDPAPSGPSALEIAGRVLFFVGLGVLIGVAWIGAAAFADMPGGLWRIAYGSWALALAGVVLIAEAQRKGAGETVGYDDIVSTSIGRALILRLALVALAGALVRIARAADGRARRRLLVLSGTAAAAAIYAHVGAGHAGTGSTRWVKVTAQWVHAVAFGVWLGGLAALIAGIRGEPGEDKARAVKRFSAVAGVTLFVVFGTGVVRALNEIPSFDALFSTGYGRVVLVKIGLIVALGALGAVNRYRNVPEARTSLAGLRRVSRAELALALAVVVAAGALASLTPPKQAIASRGTPDAIVVSGEDVAGTVRVRLAIAPGTPGPNAFTATVTEAATGEPLGGATVRLTFLYADEASVGPSELALAEGGAGTYAGTGSNLSLDGAWTAVVLVQQASDSAEVRLSFGTRCRATPLPVGGGPTLYDAELGEGRTAQMYVDPGGAGSNEIHVTYFDAEGTEMRLGREPAISAAPTGGDKVDVTVRRLSQGHFVGDATLTSGDWRFGFEIVTPDDEVLRSCFEESVE